MKKLIVLLIIVMLSTNAYASLRPCAYAIEWWLRDQNKWEGSDIRTKMEGDDHVIGYWSANGVPEPTPAELEDIIDDYEQYLADLEQEKIDSKNKTKQKLSLTDKQLEELKQALSITP